MIRSTTWSNDDADVGARWGMLCIEPGTACAAHVQADAIQIISKRTAMGAARIFLPIKPTPMGRIG